MNDFPAYFARRWNRALMDLPFGAKCRRCGEGNPLVLTIPSHGRICYECDRQVRGFSGVEGHHLGRLDDEKVRLRIPANLHRVLSIAQDWWKLAGVKPGTPVAVLLDLFFLLVVGGRWMELRQPPGGRDFQSA